MKKLILFSIIVFSGMVMQAQQANVQGINYNYNDNECSISFKQSIYPGIEVSVNKVIKTGYEETIDYAANISINRKFFSSTGDYSFYLKYSNNEVIEHDGYFAINDEALLFLCVLGAKCDFVNNSKDYELLKIRVYNKDNGEHRDITISPTNSGYLKYRINIIAEDTYQSAKSKALSGALSNF